jgi:hypothetical protein
VTTTSSSSGPGPAAGPWPGTWPPPASGSCCWSGAAGWPASRRTGPPPRCSSTTATSRPTPGMTPRARPSSRRSTTSSAVPPSCTARRCTGCDARTSASWPTTTASHRPGRSAMTTWSPTTPWPSSATRCMGRVARTRPSHRPAPPIRSRPCRMSPGSSSCPTTSPPPATTRSMPPVGSCWTRPTRRSAPASAAGPATGSRAWSTPSPTPRCWASAPRWSIPTSPWSPAPARPGWRPTRELRR